MSRRNSVLCSVCIASIAASAFASESHAGGKAPAYISGEDQSFTPGSPPSISNWRTLNAVQAPEEGGGVGSINGVIYVAGGGVPNESVLPNLQGFDPTSNSWLKNLASLPTALAEPDVATDINGLLYVAGGDDDAGTYFNSLYAYDPATNAWTTEANIPHASAAGCGGAIDGILYVTTGFDGAHYSTDLDAYNPYSNSWSSLAPSNSAHFAPACGVINGKLYVAGGLTASGKFSNVVEVYDPVANAWTTLETKMPKATAYSASVALDGRLYVFGGCLANPCEARHLTTDVYGYDPVKNKWTSSIYDNLPSSRFNFAATVDYGLMFAEGGGNAKGNVTNDNEYLAVKPSIP